MKAPSNRRRVAALLNQAVEKHPEQKKELLGAAKALAAGAELEEKGLPPRKSKLVLPPVLTEEGSTPS